jgi:superoxide dismutase, Cu-Zn family
MTRTAALLAVLAATMACERRPDVPPAQPMEGAGAGGVQQADPQPGVTPGAPVDTISVSLINSDGAPAGTALLTHDDGGVRVAIRVTGLAPGEHGFHVHETGICEPPSFETAGGHFAPHGRQHGLQNPQGPHAGDMPNLRVGADGTADTVFVAPNITLRANQPHSVVREGGAALVVHADPDDHVTDPSGNSGDRIACGVIRLP